MTTSAGTSLVAAAVPGWEQRFRPGPPHTIGVALGQGIGPEVVGAALTVLDALGDAFDLSFCLDIDDAIGRLGPHGQSLDDTAASFYHRTFAAGAPVLSGPVGGRFVYELRAQFDLYCKLVPVRPLPVLADASIVRPERTQGVDLVVVRDNAGGLYQGGYGRREGGRIAFQEAVYHTDQVDRLLDVATGAAAARRGRLAVVTKPGGIPEVSALWRERAEAAAERTEVEIDNVEVDNACFQLVADPRRFDVVAAPNLLGDVVADTAALILGSRGMSLSANFGPDGRAVYQTGHGAAYDLAGSDRANPIAQIQSLAMLLRESLELTDAARAIEDAIVAVLADGLRTPDIAGPSSTQVGTRALADAIAAQVARAPVR